LIIFRNKKLFVLFCITIFFFIIMSIVRPDQFLSLRNFQSMTIQIPDFGLLALAIALCMMTGGIDLSVVAISNLTGIATAWMLTNFIKPGMPGSTETLLIILCMLIGLIIAATCGAINGILITRVGITPILATLGTMGLFGGLGVIITKGMGITGLPEKFLFLGTEMVAKAPIQLYIFIAVILLVGLILNRTLFGFNLLMIGANPISARFSGINLNNVLLRVYILSGILSGIAGFIIIAKANSARSGYAASFLLPAVLVAVLGGTDPAGGFGTVTGVVLALILVQTLKSGFNILNFSSFFQNVVLGGMLLLVMIINFIGAKVAEKVSTKKLTAKTLK